MLTVRFSVSASTIRQPSREAFCRECIQPFSSTGQASQPAVKPLAGAPKAKKRFIMRRLGLLHRFLELARRVVEEKVRHHPRKRAPVHQTSFSGGEGAVGMRRLLLPRSVIEAGDQPS